MALFITNAGGNDNTENVFLADNTALENVYDVSAGGVELVWTKQVPPVLSEPNYELTEALLSDNGFKLIKDSKSSLDAKLCNSNGTAYLPSSTQYPENATLDLSNDKYADTGYIVSPTKELMITTVYDVLMDFSFKMQVIHYKGNSKADVYDGDQNTIPTKTQSDVDWTTPAVGFKIKEGMIIQPSIEELYYVSLNDTTASTIAEPTGITVNEYNSDAVFASHNLKRSDGSIGIVKLMNPRIWDDAQDQYSYADSASTGNNSAPIFDIQKEKGWKAKSVDRTITLTLPAGTWELTCAGYHDYYTGDEASGVTIDGITKALKLDGTKKDSGTWTVVSTGADYDIVVGTTGSTNNRGYLSGINIRKTS